MAYVYVDIDLSDHIDEVSDEYLLKELQQRGVSLEGFTFDRDYAERAYEALKANRPAEALALLDRALFTTTLSRSDVPINLARFL